jgi:hypothetical protein
LCAITGSFDLKTLQSLVELNNYRGAHSYSYSTHFKGKTVCHVKAFGEPDFGSIFFNGINEPLGTYHIIHTQAPTTVQRDLSAVHPAQDSACLLWHNGIILQTCLDELKAKHQDTREWDTYHLLLEVNKGFDKLADIQGSFSCLYATTSVLYLFRNTISPMFVDGDLNISSTQFDGSHSTEPGIVYAFDFNNKTLVPQITFTKAEEPFFFLGE